MYTSAGRASAARRRRSTSARGTCSSATTTTCSRATATSRRSTTSSGCRTSSSGGPSSVAFFVDGRSWPFNGPLDLLRFRPLSLASRVRMGIAVLLLQRRHRDVRAVRERDGARVGDPRDGPSGVGQGLGPAAARQVRRPRDRHLDGVAVEQADRAPPDQGRRSSPGAARLPARELGDPVRAAPGVDRVTRRPRDDRPARAPPVAPRRPLRRRARGARLVPRRARPAAFPAADPAEPLRRGHRHRPERHLRAAARSRARRRIGADYLERLSSDRVPHRALPPARARPAVHAVLLDEHRRRRAAVRRPDRAHQLHRARALRRQAVPLRRQLPGGAATRCSRSTPTSCSTSTSRACGRSTPASRADGSRSAGCSASRRRSRSSPSAIASGWRRSRPACPA